MSHRRSRREGVRGAPRPEDRRRSEAGDTLVEILIALTVIGVAGMAILLAFATAISGSGQHRNAVTMDTMLRTAAAEVTSAIQQQPSTVFANCSGAYVLNTTNAISLPNPNNVQPNPYTATITGAQYWLTGGATPYTFSSLAAPANTGCPTGYSTTQPGPQQLTVTVSYRGIAEIDHDRRPRPHHTLGRDGLPEPGLQAGLGGAAGRRERRVRALPGSDGGAGGLDRDGVLERCISRRTFHRVGPTPCNAEQLRRQPRVWRDVLPELQPQQDRASTRCRPAIPRTASRTLRATPSTSRQVFPPGWCSSSNRAMAPAARHCRPSQSCGSRTPPATSSRATAAR